MSKNNLVGSTIIIRDRKKGIVLWEDTGFVLMDEETKEVEVYSKLDVDRVKGLSRTILHKNQVPEALEMSKKLERGAWLGQILVINNQEWGFISYNEKRKEVNVYSLSEGRKTFFPKVDKFTLTLFLCRGNFKTVEPKVLQKIKELYASEKKVVELKPHQQFKANDGNIYYYLGKSGKSISFYSLSPYAEYSGSRSLVLEIYDKFNKDSTSMQPVRTLKEFTNLSVEDQMTIALEWFKDNMEYTKANYKVISVDAIVKGQAYNHEKHKHYTLIGAVITAKVGYDKEETELKIDLPVEQNTGFYPIYKGQATNADPIDFYETYGVDMTRFVNGYGDYFSTTEILKESKELKGKVNLKKYSNMK